MMSSPIWRFSSSNVRALIESCRVLVMYMIPLTRTRSVNVVSSVAFREKCCMIVLHTSTLIDGLLKRSRKDIKFSCNRKRKVHKIKLRSYDVPSRECRPCW